MTKRYIILSFDSAEADLLNGSMEGTIQFLNEHLKPYFGDTFVAEERGKAWKTMKEEIRMRLVEYNCDWVRDEGSRSGAEMWLDDMTKEELDEQIKQVDDFDNGVELEE